MCRQTQQKMVRRSQRVFKKRTVYFADHAFLGGTYQEAQSKFIKNLRENEGFYSGSTR